MGFNKLKMLDLFSGVQGFHQGLSNAGIEFSWSGYSEIDKHAIAVCKYHKTESEYLGDVKSIKPDRLPARINLVTFGWPCQDNSLAGKRKGQSGSRSGLLAEAVRILRIKKPDYFIAENVPGLFSVNKGSDFYEAIRLFANAGYDVQWQVLNTEWFLPQHRERIYFAGHLRGKPRPEIFPITESDCGNNEACKGKAGKVQHKDPQIACCLASRSFKGGGNLIELTKDVPQGQRVYDIRDSSITLSSGGGGLGRKTGLYAIPVSDVGRINKKQNGRRFKEDGEPSFTLTGQDQHGIYDGVRIRRLTPLETERLQGLPDNYTKYGINEKGEVYEVSDSQRYRMTGNMVSIPVVQVIGRKLKPYLDNL